MYLLAFIFVLTFVGTVEVPSNHTVVVANRINGDISTLSGSSTGSRFFMWPAEPTIVPFVTYATAYSHFATVPLDFDLISSTNEKDKYARYSIRLALYVFPDRLTVAQREYGVNFDKFRLTAVRVVTEWQQERPCDFRYRSNVAGGQTEAELRSALEKAGIIFDSRPVVWIKEVAIREYIPCTLQTVS